MTHQLQFAQSTWIQVPQSLWVVAAARRQKFQQGYQQHRLATPGYQHLAIVLFFPYIGLPRKVLTPYLQEPALLSLPAGSPCPRPAVPPAWGDQFPQPARQPQPTPCGSPSLRSLVSPASPPAKVPPAKPVKAIQTNKAQENKLRKPSSRNQTQETKQEEKTRMKPSFANRVQESKLGKATSGTLT